MSGQEPALIVEENPDDPENYAIDEPDDVPESVKEWIMRISPIAKTRAAVKGSSIVSQCLLRNKCRGPV